MLSVVCPFSLRRDAGSKMNEMIKKEKIRVENMIYEIRGKQVMLNRELSRTK